MARIYHNTQNICLQGLLFLTDRTLLGSKQRVYVLLKIIKLCTGSKVSSYQLKFAVDDRLANTNPDKIGMGEAIRKVMEYVTIKNRFGSVHTDLAEIGITEVKVTDKGLQFVGFQKDTNLSSSPVRDLIKRFEKTNLETMDVNYTNPVKNLILGFGGNSLEEGKSQLPKHHPGKLSNEILAKFSTVTIKEDALPIGSDDDRDLDTLERTETEMMGENLVSQTVPYDRIPAKDEEMK